VTPVDVKWWNHPRNIDFKSGFDKMKVEDLRNRLRFKDDYVLDDEKDH